MGRQIIAEESIESQISSLYGKDKWLIGAIIGQVTNQKDYAVHLATTPKANGEAVVDEDDGTVTSKKSGRGMGQSLDKVDELWCVTHARQVLRMLPGGFEILGIFGMAPPDMMNASQAKLRQVLFAVSKLDKQTHRDDSSIDRVILQICPITRKLTCRTFDVTDPRSTAKPADWKYQRYLDRWHRVETNISLNSIIPVSNDTLSRTLEKQILQGVKPFCDNIWNSVATIDSQITNGDRLLNPTQPLGKKGKKQQEEATGNIYTIQLLQKQSAIPKSDVRSPSVTPCGAKLSITGTMCCRGYVHGKATVDEAVKALKFDVVRSLMSRCELLCEDLLQSEEEQDPKVLYETPVRVFAPLRGSEVQLCDYMFPDETNNDVVDRFKELMDLTIPEDTLDTDMERLPDEADLAKPEHNISNPSKTSTTSPKSFQMLVILLGIAAVLLAVLIAVLFTRDSHG